jgi:predicted membrane protein
MCAHEVWKQVRLKNSIKMKIRTILFGIALLLAGVVHAQEFKLAKNSGRLEIYLGKVTVEGHSGSEIIFSSDDERKEKDKRAEGLRSLNSLGLDDNTGLGINVSDKGNVVEVRQLKKTNSPNIKILVPKGMIVSFSHESQYGGEVKFKNLTNEIEVSAQYNSVELENVTGPLTVKSIYGHVEAVFDSNVKGPISIVSVYGFADVTLPATTKANLKLSTSYGEILVAPEFKIDVEKKNGMVEYSDRIAGTLNGGGMSIDITCNYGKVYLRKK